ncbi:reactive intermediate/imine deaminase [Vibrio anguillarum]|uniref:Reactive intermediate/imine deaminase n=1 Tax=Vibrio anguillarum TaxID=55601 RepID=A0AAW4AYD9_VIBAN|nr:Rid family detoxifying hydrolase [Vibrio anguillarum]AEH34948.1 Translation initiation inhibitor [Vibrio anguillarum 775]AGU59506.1 endoribonuclease L-PSP [Vibrio anguillarum M3]ASF93342.1 reactive intermediate/imine deaminase [Vibrio anguillarum]ATA51654.1 reactive intermediate/imine deaminase [Vibrio anguillarum]AVT66391.1 reactive intermediate/imine deaminase [Vibrio anguillarum]
MAADIVKVSRNTENAPICAVSTQTVAFSHYNNISAQLPIDPKTGEIVIGCINDQTKQCLNNIQSIVESIGHVMDDVVKMNIFVKNISDIDAIKKVYPTFFQGPLPTVTIAAVAALPVSDALVQIDALISNGEGTAPQAPCELIKVSRNTEHAPQGLYSQTAAFSHYNNLSAQLPIEPKTGEIVQGGIKEQSQQCLNNINAILESIGHTMADIVKTTIFLKNISDAEAINEVCGQFFPSYVPARSLVSVADLPMNALVQIDVVVSHGDGTPPQLPEDARLLVIEANNTVNAPEVDYSHSVAFSHYNHISGQLPLSPKNNEVVAGGIKEQVKQCLENIKNIVESVEHVMDDIVKVNIQIKNMDDINIVNDVYTTFFNHELPARTVIGVSELPMDALIQIDAVVSNCEGTPPKH